MTRSRERDLDIVVFGATGFTGALTAEYLVANRPPGTRLAIAGRNRGKLEALRDRLGADVTILAADIDDEASVRRVAEASRVVATTVGPYIRYGAPLVAACAAAGTDYTDLTGEAEFVDLTYLRHHATAQRTGARLVHACGFDSIPPDIGALFTVSQLPPDRPIRLRGYVSASGLPSGGTFDSTVTAFSRFRRASAIHAERRRAEAAEAAAQADAAEAAAQAGPAVSRETAGSARRARVVPGRPGFDRDAGAWVLPLPTIDPQIVVRSARALECYGPDFSYSHFAAVGNPFIAAGLTAGAAATFALAQLPPTRAVLRRLRPPGAGPSAERRERSWFRVRFVADSGDRRVVTEVSGGDPGYGETSKMLAESALCLAHDALPETAGQVTTAVAMGHALRLRLANAGISFRVVEAGDAA